MELLGGISAGEWSSLNGIYDHHDQLIMASDHDHDHCNFPSHEYAVPNYDMGASNFGLPFTIWPNGNDSTIIHDMPGTYYNHDVSKFCDYNYHPAETMVTSNIVFCEARNNAKLLHDIEGDHDNNDQWLNINQEVSNAGEESGGSQTTAAYLVPQLKWEPDMMITVPEQSNMENASLSENIFKKRSRSTTTDNQDNPKNKRNVKSRKGKKCALSDDEEEGSAGSGEKYSDASHEELGGMASSPSPSPSPRGPAALNLNGKTRASRGSATDPQSVYARKRREKINERLRILQNLVPNGTKVDISTMLEEAVQYVKFLQLQIKLLSSDEMWMYAPLAYNGMDIGLDHLRLAASRQ